MSTHFIEYNLPIKAHLRMQYRWRTYPEVLIPLQVMLLQLVLYLSVSGCFAQFGSFAAAGFSGESGPIMFMNFAKTESYSLKGHVVATFHVPNDVECSFKCLLNSTCLSFNYGGTKMNGLYTCELNNADKFFHPRNFTTKQGFLYGGDKVFKLDN